MCDYRERCGQEGIIKVINDKDICFGTGTGCLIRPIMKELDSLREEIKDYKKGEKESENKIRRYQEAIKKYRQITSEFLNPFVENHEKIEKLEREINDIM